MDKKSGGKERKEIALRLKKARFNAGFVSGQKDAAEHFKWNYSTYKSHESGRNGIGVPGAKKYAAAFGVSAEWILLGKTTTEDRDIKHSKIKDFHESRDADIESSSAYECVTVNEIETRIGGGAMGADSRVLVVTDNGVTISTDAVKDKWCIPESFLRGELRIGGENAHVLEVYGDSMYDPRNPGAPGSLFPGDRILVDISDRNPPPPGPARPFAVWDGIGLVAKLVEVAPGSEGERIRLSSRNPAYPPYEVTADEAHIIGRIRVRVSRM